MKKTVIILALALLAFPSLAGSRSVYITKTGARPGLSQDNAPAIQRAIDQVSSAGGGTVIVPAGDFLTGPVELKSGVELHLEKGARLVGKAELAAYEKAHPIVDGQVHSCSGLIYSFSQKDVAVTGLGTIDGQGGDPAFALVGDPGGRPMILFFYDCKNVVVSDVRLENSAHWVERYLDCDGVRVTGVKVYSHCNYNNDGIDIDSKNVVVSDCIFDSEDDAICLKSNSSRLCENVTITNCIAASVCNAIKFGTASFGGFRNITISNICIRQSSEDNFIHCYDWLPGLTSPITAMAGIALEMVDGGIAENINISNITMRDVQTPIFVRLGRRAPVPTFPEGTRLKGVIIRGVNAVCESLIASQVAGVPGLYPEDIILSDIDITLPGGATMDMVLPEIPEVEASYPENRNFGYCTPAYGLYLRHARNVTMSNVHFHLKNADERPAVLMDDCTDIVQR